MNNVYAMPKIHNTFYLEAVNIKTGQVQKAKAQNIVCDSYFMNTDNIYGNVGAVACGSGTTEPSKTDTKLANQLFAYNGPQSSNYTRIDENTIRKKLTFVIPATTSYVGTITEVGLVMGNSTGLFNRALLKDAEGNAISIVKTDLDQLTIVVDVFFTRDTSHGFLWSIGKPSIFYRYGGIQNIFYGITVGTFSTFSWHAMYLAGTKTDEYWPHTFAGMEVGTPAADKTLKTRSLGTMRFGTDVGNTHYINSISYLGGNEDGTRAWLYHQTFPNDIFGHYQVKDIAVGSGDGFTTDFEPPLGLWVKDSEVIYVDGVPLTRGVDYTVDHKANRTKMFEITPGNFIKGVKNELGGTWPGKFSVGSMRVPFTAAYENTTVGVSTSNKPMIRKDSALFIELQEDEGIGLDVNYWVPGYWTSVADSTTSTKTATGVTLTLSYSEDGNTYTEADNVLLSNDAFIAQRDLPNTISAKYWKLEIKDGADATSYFNSTYSSSQPTVSMLGYYGDPIKLMTPPAEGSVITMDCSLDRPYKNQNFIIDYSCTWQF